MEGTHIEQPAPTERQIQNLVESIAKIDEEIKGNKDILKNYKIKSDELTRMSAQKKELQDAINEEKERIENVHAEDPTFAEARADEQRLTNQKKEKIAELKQAMKLKHAGKMANIFKEEVMTASGGQMLLNLEFAPRVYLNGKELKS